MDCRPFDDKLTILISASIPLQPSIAGVGDDLLGGLLGEDLGGGSKPNPGPEVESEPDLSSKSLGYRLQSRENGLGELNSPTPTPYDWEEANSPPQPVPLQNPQQNPLQVPPQEVPPLQNPQEVPQPNPQEVPPLQVPQDVPQEVPPLQVPQDVPQEVPVPWVRLPVRLPDPPPGLLMLPAPAAPLPKRRRSEDEAKHKARPTDQSARGSTANAAGPALAVEAEAAAEDDEEDPWEDPWEEAGPSAPPEDCLSRNRGA